MTSRKLLKVRAGAVAATALAALVIAGCGGGEGSSSGSAKTKEGGTLHVTNGEENTTLNPLKALTVPDITVTATITEPLWKEDFQGKIVPWLVEKYETSADKKVWTLHLRPGIKFSNGKPMTIEDVVFSLEKGREDPYYGELLDSVTSVKASAPSTVVIENEVPAPELPLILSQWTFGVMPKNFGGMSEKEFGQHPIGTGPFKFASWKKGEALTLEKNPYYWRPNEPRVDKLVFHTVEDPNSRTSQLSGGELDLAYAPPWEQLEALEQNSETEVQEFPLGISYLIVLNVRRPLFQNVKVREAVNLALDREGMVQTALRGRGKTAGAYVSPPVFGYNPHIKAPEQSIAKAKKLLAEAVAEGVNPSFTLTIVKEVPFWATAAQIAQANLNEAGFKVSITKTDGSTGFAQADEGEFDAFAWLNWEPGAASELFSFYNAFEGNWSGTDTTKMEELLTEARREIDVKRRERDYWHMQEIVANEQNLILVAFAPYVWGLQRGITGLIVGKAGIPWFAKTGFSG